ncbi:patatin-like phospholipase family protein [Nitrobacter sp. TKz-YC02]|uniref:patatin-like phospholipase family protein n=1 Tax=Nitrobacter sp. TKz-YC02 TaxID=3398704 RepID=UPI003CF857A6
MSDQKSNVFPRFAPGTVTHLVTNFAEVYGAEYADIRQAPRATRSPSAQDGMIGLALSGGGIRSASFCLGVLQALNAEGVLKKFNYLSTVSGGGYIGTSMTVSMSAAEIEEREKAPASAVQPEAHDRAAWRFPFGKTGEEIGETDETRHLRDRSRYLLQNGIASALSALVIYLRGIAMNVLIVFPFLLLGAAFFALCKPDTHALVSPPSWLSWLPKGVLESGWPLTICASGAFAVFLIVYAVAVSIVPILRKSVRQNIAKGATIVLLLCIVPVLLEIHFALLRLMFKPEHMGIVSNAAGPTAETTTWFSDVPRLVGLITPVVIAVMPFLKRISEKAVKAATTSLSDAASKWTSRIVLIVVAAVIPLLLWLVTLQLAYWAIGISSCETQGTAGCNGPWGSVSWDQSPPILNWLFQRVNTFVPIYGASAAYAMLAVLQLVLWPLINVNSNSLHQLYRDRLGGAFLFRRRSVDGVLEEADRFPLSQLVSEASPYLLVNVALNVPGSSFANRRGRNADFFLFSKRFVGSELTGYVDTRLAEAAMDGLNAGTAMAISGAAAAPNMGIASMRPLSATIALLNVRLGRWMLHPYDIVKYARTSGLAQWWRGRPGPTRLLSEAFFKSGADVAELNKNGGKDAGFVFLTDGGHIENLGVYELLRRRCSVIVAVDAEADPDYNFSSLVQLERFARIDLGTRIVLNWQPIREQSRSVSKSLAAGERSSQAGPHVAIGLIDYPPSVQGGPREEGVFVYIKSSMSGDENDYIFDYKRRNPEFPQESTMEQLFSEEQLEAYRALGEHVTRRFCRGEDDASLVTAHARLLVSHAMQIFPSMRPALEGEGMGAA